MKSHEPKRPKEGPKKRPKTNNGICSICQKKFEYQSYLNRHMKTHNLKMEGEETKLDFDSSYVHQNSLTSSKNVSSIVKTEPEIESKRVLEHSIFSENYFPAMNIGTPSNITGKHRSPSKPEDNSKNKRRKQNLNQRNIF